MDARFPRREAGNLHGRAWIAKYHITNAVDITEELEADSMDAFR